MHFKLLTIFLSLGSFAISVVYAQEVKFQKRILSQPSQLGTINSFQQKTLLVNSFNKTSARSFVESNKTIDLGKNDVLLHLNQDAFYKMTTLEDGTKELVKVKNNISVNKVEFTAGEEVEAIDEEGNFLYVDFLDGNASTYLFYSPDLEPESKYSPYSFFNYTNYGYSNKIVCIYSQEKNSSLKFKLSVLTHKGNLLIEKEFDREKFLASDVKILNDRIFLLMNSTQGAASKVICFDNRLNVLWQRNFSSRIVNYQIELGKNSNSLLLSTPNELSYVNAKGENIWTVSYSDFLQGYQSKSIEIESVLEDQYVAVSVAEYSENTKKYTNNVLTFLNIKNGNRVYSEKLVDSTKEVKVVDVGTGSFIVIHNSEVNEYRKQ